MKTSVAVLLTDILPHTRKTFNKIVKSKLFNNLSQEEVFLKLKKSGIEGVELLLPTDVALKDIEDVKKVLDKNKMKVLSVHQALRFLTKTKLKEIMILFEVAKMLKSKVIVLHMNSAGKQVFDRGYIMDIHALQKKYGIKVGFENREKYVGSLKSAYGWDEKEFSALMKKENFYITLDVCHMGQAGGDIINFFRDNKDHIINIHLSDYKAHYLNSSLRPLRYKHLPLGKGKLPLTEFIKVIKQEKYKGNLTLEIHTDLEGIMEGARIVKNTS